MNANIQNTEQPEILFDRLQAFLEEQEQLIRKSDYRNVEKLSRQADPIIAELVKAQLPRQPRWEHRCEQLTKQYKKLELMLEAEKSSVRRQLQKIGAGKKTVQAYQSSD